MAADPASFEALFRTATGQAPPAYLTQIARDGLPPIVRAPATGQAGLILAWLWRRLGRHQAGTPRRLVYALPPRTPLEPAAAQAGRWLARLGLTGQVALHVGMGPPGASPIDWRMDLDQPAIVLGTTDILVSKAVNRGYATGSALFPIEFALVTNGAHWIIEETRLCPQATTTLRQVAEFTRRRGIAEPFGLTCMTATGSPNPKPLDRQSRPPEPAVPPGPAGLPEPPGPPVPRSRSWAIRRLDAAPGDYAAIAAAAAARHQPGTLTLVALATVASAVRVYQALDGQSAPRLLLHPCFRGTERAELIQRLAEPLGEAGRIVVITPEVQAAVVSPPAALVTEAADWPMTVRAASQPSQDGGGSGSGLWWIPPPGPQPDPQVAATCAELARLEGRTVTTDDLLAREPDAPALPAAVLTEAEMDTLFGTDAGDGLDIARYVRDAGDLDVQVTWATWTRPGAQAPPPADAWFPPQELRCLVPLNELAGFLRRDGVTAWRPERGPVGWARVEASTDVRPLDVVLVSAASGGYDPELGFDPAIRIPVPGCPDLVSAAEPTAAERAAGSWVSLDRHSEQTRDQAAGLLAALDAQLPSGADQTVVTAAYLHDLGKAHPVWQDALCRMAAPQQAAVVEAGRPWAKSGTEGRLVFAGGGRFLHELASLLLLDGPMRGMLAGVPDPDLARYLVLAHHGRLRTSVHDADADTAPGADTAPDADTAAGSGSGAGADGKPALFGLASGARAAIPPLLGRPAATLTVDLGLFLPAGDNGWGRTAALLRDRYGPFVLAYLETLVRIADWRASALAATQ
jgi:CRISPR-associated endonuclease/helicase Cas3